MQDANGSVVVEPLALLYKMRFDDIIEKPSYYREEIDVLETANVNDVVEITVNSDGGSLPTGIEITNAISSCKAQSVHGILRSSCSSCGSIIFLACDTHEVGLASEMLLHSGFGGSGGTPAQQVHRAESYKKQVRTLFETVYKGFVTDEELDQMIDQDREFILCDVEIQERLEKMYEYREEAAKAMEAVDQAVDKAIAELEVEFAEKDEESESKDL